MAWPWHTAAQGEGGSARLMLGTVPRLPSPLLFCADLYVVHCGHLLLCAFGCSLFIFVTLLSTALQAAGVEAFCAIVQWLEL